MSYINSQFGSDVDRHVRDVMDIAELLAKNEPYDPLTLGMVNLFISWCPYWYDDMVDAWDQCADVPTWEDTGIIRQARYLLSHCEDCAEAALATLPDITGDYKYDMPDPRKTPTQ